ncbi:hypothetical protein ANAPRD1_01119 [Anaplasma phagocytophilum]|nr:hypothetical protein [Anaplasma phagocytophilum]SCV66531.1 hypothetical protein ANAPRD1_01119 [Anaplasma phagocytophilum]
MTGSTHGSDIAYAVVSAKDATHGDTTLCGDIGDGSASSGHSAIPQVLKDFVKETLGDGSRNWPTSTVASSGKKPDPVTNDNATAVATDLTKLSSEEKTIVAGLLAKTIEGGEVVEICVSPCRAWLS